MCVCVSGGGAGGRQPDNPRIQKMRGELANATTDDVAEWVASLGLDEYTRTFKQHSIDGAQLLELTDDQLRGELGISKIGHRARIRRERDVLLARSKPSSAVALRPAADPRCALVRPRGHSSV